ncbi:MAG TPA: hypothetical protein VLV78_17705 [Thermoanaerobaculia bacterium]|nr:hypothetical protein [Thermoanaerobaculia bacterium]
MADSLRDWGFDVETFRKKAEASVDNARGDLSEITGILRQTLSQTKQTLLDLQKSREPVAAELKSGFEKAWNDIEEAFAKARQAMREKREVVTTSSEHLDDSYWLG